MAPRKVLAIGLDGYEQSLAERLMADGELPHLDALRARSASFLLDHGPATRTGLAWEHASTGKSPEASGRSSAIDFDTNTYEVWHTGTSLTPFPAGLNARTVIFDPPYFDLSRAPAVRGVMDWGAHDPGVAAGSRPAELMDELVARFGAYPACDSMYDIVWASPAQTRAMGDSLVHATDVRTRAARWLLEERCPNWDFAFVVAGEIHSAIENMWHGIDPAHPLHGYPSSKDAEDRLRAVFRATDRLVGELVSAFPDATVVCFAMNGMGPNHSDVASMALLSELLYRHNFHRPLLRVPKSWSDAPQGIPMLDSRISWTQAVKTEIRQLPESLDFARRAAARLLPENIKRLLRPKGPNLRNASDGLLRLPLDWMPTDLYQPYWRKMRCFSLPSFYDGRVRINLAGREREGIVSSEDYESVCDEVESLVKTCRDTRDNAPVVNHVVRCGGQDPLALGPSESDLIIVWDRAALGFCHPVLGRVGPLPYRRTGGHTGPYGMAYVAGDGIAPGSFGIRSSFDVVPTIFSLLGEQLPQDLQWPNLALTKS